ncbi:MAG: hypothetical protein LBQ12_08185 [Deltaproteobacteria bacterium]|jgi:hypothetical protein|nr:hypothetical protein [Deltaproteobacteria bacterium]
MSDIRTVIIVTDAFDRKGPAGALASEGALFTSFEFGVPPSAHVAGGILEAGNAAGALERLDSGALLVKADISGAELGEGLKRLAEDSPLKTVFALLAPGALAFWGHAIARGTVSEKPATSMDVLPTLAMVGEFLLAPGVEGRVLFEVLKNPSYKQGQVGRLKAALARLEKALKRDSQEPWDKHDCA